jgi:hypothetical protein
MIRWMLAWVGETPAAWMTWVTGPSAAAVWASASTWARSEGRLADHVVAVATEQCGGGLGGLDIVRGEQQGASGADLAGDR